MNREEIEKDIQNIFKQLTDNKGMPAVSDRCSHCETCYCDKIISKFANFIVEHENNLLKEFVEHFKQILNKEIWECEDEIDCEIHCSSLAPEELEVWKAQRQVDIKRLKWAVENIDFELKLFLEEVYNDKRRD